jgi:hypothetical protein
MLILFGIYILIAPNWRPSQPDGRLVHSGRTLPA